MNTYKHFGMALYRFRVFHEDLGPSHLVLVVVHVDRAEKVEDPLLLWTPPAGPRLRSQNSIPADKTTHKHTGKMTLE